MSEKEKAMSEGLVREAVESDPATSATKADLAAVEMKLGTDIAKVEMNIAELKTNQTELKADIAEIKEQMKV